MHYIFAEILRGSSGLFQFKIISNFSITKYSLHFSHYSSIVVTILSSIKQFTMTEKTKGTGKRQNTGKRKSGANIEGQKHTLR